MDTKRSAHRILTELEQSGDLSILVKSGVCSTCVMRNLELYRYVDSRIKTGSKVNSAVESAEVQFRVCRQTVFNILKTFK